jgi:hypothetical protein
MAATQTSILALINEIQTAANYPAIKMNPLLTQILAAAYGPMYISDVPPSLTNDENSGYRPGSVGYNTVNRRYYICKSAIAGNAEWILIPSDANFQSKEYAALYETISLNENTSVFKCTNTNIAVNFGCSVLLPSNPFNGKTLVLYFENAITNFFIKDSSEAIINGGNSLTIPAGQQYTITYSGTAWEIVGVNNTTAGSLSGVDVSNVGGVVTTDTTNLTFLGSAVTVTNDLSGGTDITINPLAGVDVTRGATVVAAAQSIDFTNNFTVTADGTGADVAFVSRTTIKQDGTQLTGPGNTIGGFDFRGSMFSEVPVALNASIAEITLNGAKVLIMSGDVSPTASNDSSQGYSLGSVGRNIGNLLRTYICRGNAVGAAVWDRITEDNGYSAFTPVNAATNQINFYVANVLLNPAGAILLYDLLAPQYAYVGKKVFIRFSSSITEFTFRNTSGPQPGVGGILVAANTTIIMVCTNESTQSWVRIG